MPTVSSSWNRVPRVPRMLVSAISEMYMGATTQKLPVEMPAKGKKRILMKVSLNPLQLALYQLEIFPSIASRQSWRSLGTTRPERKVYPWPLPCSVCQWHPLCSQWAEHQQWLQWPATNLPSPLQEKSRNKEQHDIMVYICMYI